MSEFLHKSYNVTVLIYHLVFPAKYRRVVFDEAADGVLKEVCLDLEKRYQVKFLEIGTDKATSIISFMKIVSCLILSKGGQVGFKAVFFLFLIPNFSLMLFL